MDAILDWGIALIQSLQGLGGWLIQPMRGVTYLGVEEFFLLIAPVIYWCFDAALGLRVGVGLIVCSSLNSCLKLLFHGPRPFWHSPDVRAFVSETSFGPPSGHAQNAVVVWGLLADHLKRRWAWAAAVVIMILIGLSRIVLGVHFPQDVLVGWTAGALILWGFLKLERPATSWLGDQKPSKQVAVALAASIALIVLGYLSRLTLAGWNLPQVWFEQAARAIPEADPIDPLALSGIVAYAGVLFGLAGGAIWLKREGWLNARGPAWKRILRFLVGIVGVFALWAGLRVVFPSGETPLALLLRYVRYGLVGLWIAGIAPILFVRVGLADKTGP